MNNTKKEGIQLVRIIAFMMHIPIYQWIAVINNKVFSLNSYFISVIAIIIVFVVSAFLNSIHKKGQSFEDSYVKEIYNGE